MKRDQTRTERTAADSFAAPLTLEGFAVLHQMFRLRRDRWRELEPDDRQRLIGRAVDLFDGMNRRDEGESAIFAALGHKSDLIAVHFRPSFDGLSEAEREVGTLGLSDYLEQTTSYLSVIEIGLYQRTAQLYAELRQRAIEPQSAEWREAVEAELARQRIKMAPRLFPRIPARRYLCFYPMDKKRDGEDNWYRLALEERVRLMHEHGLVGRRFAGQVTQIISGSIGFDDWEWGVDLFADDPVVFKKLVYEMRFDEASASYAKFGAFHIGLRLAPSELARFLAV